MLLLTQPRTETLGTFLCQQSELDFTYAAVGATAATPPRGFQVDHTRVSLGHGEAVFAAAREALEDWQQFDLGWLRAWSRHTPIEPGRTVAVVARQLGLWWVNACRIVYVVDERSTVNRFGFAYGTLPGHVESGEERFLLEMVEDGGVWYDILAFSQPRHPLARLGHPYVRRLQKRFGRESARAMRTAVDAARVTP